MSRIEEALAKAAGMKPVPAVQGARSVPADQSGASGFVAPGNGNGQVRSPMPEAVRSSVARLSEETMVVINEPLSPAAEEYRKLKEALVKLTRRERFDNLVVVTSATVGEGKSVTAINLAVSLAGEFDHTVLLIDADLRRPSVHKYLNLDAHKGLSDCLREGIDVGELLVKTQIGKLSVLPAGTPVANPVELFSSETMRRLFQEMKTRYRDRYIIIDTPPVLPFAETRSIVSIADWALLVVREGQPSLGQIQETLEALDHKVLGVVYNAAQSHAGSSYNYYSSYSG
jgi:exopolysaccharide/PEP-CTERM locus tyrosine autokinase